MSHRGHGSVRMHQTHKCALFSAHAEHMLSFCCEWAAVDAPTDLNLWGAAGLHQ